MEPLAGVFNRFIRLLPFLANLNSYRRFHYELFYPYPDVWGDSDSSAPSRAPSRPLGHSIHPYLAPTDLDPSHSGRREPFC